MVPSYRPVLVPWSLWGAVCLVYFGVAVFGFGIFGSRWVSVLGCSQLGGFDFRVASGTFGCQSPVCLCCICGVGVVCLACVALRCPALPCARFVCSGGAELTVIG